MYVYWTDCIQEFNNKIPYNEHNRNEIVFNKRDVLSPFFWQEVHRFK